MVNWISRVVLLLASLAAVTPIWSASDFYRCKSRDGTLVLQDKPCDGLAPVDAVVPQAVPPVTATQNRPQPSDGRISLGQDAGEDDATGVIQPDEASEPVFAADEAAEEREWQAEQERQKQQERQFAEKLAQEAATRAEEEAAEPSQPRAETAYEERMARSAEQAKQFQPQLPYGLWPWLPSLLLVLGVLGFSVPFLRNTVRDMLDGRERNHPEFSLPEPLASIATYLNITGWFVQYRGPWWRGGALGGAWMLLWIAILGRTDAFITAFWCSPAVPLVLWSLYRGWQYRFRLLGEYEHYERQYFPELYENNPEGEYQIPEDAPQRLNQHIVVLAVLSAVTGGLAWWAMGGSFFANVMFVIFGAICAVALMMLVGSIAVRLYVAMRM